MKERYLTKRFCWDHYYRLLSAKQAIGVQKPRENGVFTCPYMELRSYLFVFNALTYRQMMFEKLHSVREQRTDKR